MAYTKEQIDKLKATDPAIVKEALGRLDENQRNELMAAIKQHSQPEQPKQEEGALSRFGSGVKSGVQRAFRALEEMRERNEQKQGGEMAKIFGGSEDQYKNATGQFYQKSEAKRVADEQTYQQQAQQGGFATKAGQFVGQMLPAAAASAVAPGKAAGLAGRMALSGAQSYATSKAFTPGTEEERQKAGVIGGVIGAAGPAVAKAASKVGSKALDLLVGTKLGNVLGIKTAVRPEFAGAKELAAEMQSKGLKPTVADVTGDPALITRQAALSRNDPEFMKQVLAQNRQLADVADKAVSDLKSVVASEKWTNLDQVKAAAASGGKRAAYADRLLTAIENSGDDWKEIAQQSGKLKLFLAKLQADANHDKLSRLAKLAGLKKMYHGTEADFSEFDPSKLREGSIGVGAYFTSEPSTKWGSKMVTTRVSAKAVDDTFMNMALPASQNPSAVVSALKNAEQSLGIKVDWNKPASEAFRQMERKLGTGGVPSGAKASKWLVDNGVNGAMDSKQTVVYNLEKLKLGGISKFGDESAGLQIQPTKTTSTLDSVISRLEGDAAGDPGTLAFLKKIQRDISSGKQDLSFDGMRQTRSSVGNRISLAIKGQLVPPSEVTIMERLKKAIESDIEKSMARFPDLKQAYQKAKFQYETEVGPYKDTEFSKALTNADPTAGARIFESLGDSAKQKRFFDLLEDKGKAAVRFGLLDKAVTAGERSQAGVAGVAFSPASVATQIEKMGKAGLLDIVFQGSDRQAVDGLAKIMRSMQSYGTIGVPNTGTGVTSESLGAATKHLGLSTLAGKAWDRIHGESLKKALMDPESKYLLIRASRMKPADPQLIDIASKLAGVTAAKAGVE